MPSSRRSGAQFSQKAAVIREYPYPIKNPLRFRFEGEGKSSFFWPKRPTSLVQKRFRDAIGVENYRQMSSDLSTHDLDRIARYPSVAKQLIHIMQSPVIAGETIHQTFKWYDEWEREEKRGKKTVPKLNEKQLSIMCNFVLRTGERFPTALACLGGDYLNEIMHTTQPTEIARRISHELELVNNAPYMQEHEYDTHDQFMWFQNVRRKADYFNKHAKEGINLLYAAGNFAGVLDWARQVGSIQALVEAYNRYGGEALKELQDKDRLGTPNPAFGASVRSLLRQPTGKLKGKARSPKQELIRRKRLP